MTFKLIDTPGIATKIDYEDFLKYKMKKGESKKRAKEATQGVIESIKWLDDMDVVVVPEGFSLQLGLRGETDYISIILSPEDANRLAVFLLQLQQNPANFVARAGAN